jgi:DNA-binding beta-propeller fold protein YncE
MYRTASAALLCLLTAFSTGASGQYKILANTKVGGAGGFDYVFADSDGRKLYVARSGAGAHVAVFNLDTLAPVGDIPNLTGIHGATVDPKTGHGFVSGKPVTMFDAKTLAVIKTIDVQGNPDGYLDDPMTSRVYILSHSAPNVTVIDAKDGTVLGTIDLGGAPEQAVSDGKGHLYIDLEDKDAVAVVDATAMKLTGTYDVKSKGGGCAGLAIDAKNGILFAACRDKKNMIILSAKDGHIITDLPIGVGCDGAVFNPATMETFSSQGDGTLTVIKENSPTSFVVEQTVTTPARAKTITLDAKTGKLFLITAEYGPPPTPATPPAPGARPARAAMIPDSFSIVTVGK